MILSGSPAEKVSEESDYPAQQNPQGFPLLQSDLGKSFLGYPNQYWSACFAAAWGWRRQKFPWSPHVHKKEPVFLLEIHQLPRACEGDKTEGQPSFLPIF